MEKFHPHLKICMREMENAAQAPAVFLGGQKEFAQKS
jgi:hypothetical protein